MAGRKKKSKKRSAGKNKLPNAVFFIDRALGTKTVPKLLKDAGFRIEVLRDHFPEDCEDEVWLTDIGKRKWIVLTKDKNIRRNPLQRKALLDAGIAAFILTSTHLTGQEMGEVFVKAKNRIFKFLKNHSKPFIAIITKDGNIKKVC